MPNPDEGIRPQADAAEERRRAENQLPQQPEIPPLHINNLPNRNELNQPPIIANEAALPRTYNNLNQNNSIPPLINENNNNNNNRIEQNVPLNNIRRGGYESRNISINNTPPPPSLVPPTSHHEIPQPSVSAQSFQNNQSQGSNIQSEVNMNSMNFNNISINNNQFNPANVFLQPQFMNGIPFPGMIPPMPLYDSRNLFNFSNNVNSYMPMNPNDLNSHDDNNLIMTRDQLKNLSIEELEQRVEILQNKIMAKLSTVREDIDNFATSNIDKNTEEFGS